MGQLKSDGKASLGGVTWPAGIITFGDLYRLAGWTGISMDSFTAADTLRKGGMEWSERIWYVKVPAALVAAKGDYLAWATAAAATFQRGDTDLEAFVLATHKFPCAIVEETVDANDYCGIRVLNVGPSGA